jgi:hypothetical protein
VIVVLFIPLLLGTVVCVFVRVRHTVGAAARQWP